MTTTISSEARLVRQIGIAMRVVVFISWCMILTVWTFHQIPHAIATGAFEFFRVITVVAALWLIAEMAEAIAGRTSFGNVGIDALLILSMYFFWFLVALNNF